MSSIFKFDGKTINDQFSWHGLQKRILCNKNQLFRELHGRIFVNKLNQSK